MMNTPNKKSMAFQVLAPGLAKKGNQIFARIRVGGKPTWRSTQTADLELALKWKENWDRKRWLEKQGYIANEPSTALRVNETATRKKGNNDRVPKSSELSVKDLLDMYVAAGHPIVGKGGLKRKARRSIKNETYSLTPLRMYFDRKIAEQLTVGYCDYYHRWRNSGGYVARFKVRGNDVTRQTRGGDRAVDLELIVLNNAFQLAVRRGLLKNNPICQRGQYADQSTVRHCREVAPTPEGLKRIVEWLETNGFVQDADLTLFLAYSGLRLGEGLCCRWSQVDWAQELIRVKRTKKGVFPFVVILDELSQLLHRMRVNTTSSLLFSSPFNPNTPRNDSSYRRRLKQAAAACALSHVTPHGLHSYYVTQARQSGLTDAEIAYLIGDRSGPALISQVYGDVRPDHLLAVARKIQLGAKTREPATAEHQTVLEINKPHKKP